MEPADDALSHDEAPFHIESKVGLAFNIEPISPGLMPHFEAVFSAFGGEDVCHRPDGTNRHVAHIGGTEHWERSNRFGLSEDIGLDGLLLSFARYEADMTDFRDTTLPLLRQAGLR